MKKVLILLILAAIVSAVVSPGALSVVAELPSPSTEASVVMEGLPFLTAPGATIPLHWVITGGTLVEETCVYWDTFSHDYDNAYRYRVPFQRWESTGHFFDYLDVPAGTETIYIKPYAVVDGDIVWAGREYTVPTRRGIDVGTDVSRYDSAGDWWDADVSFGHHWYGFEGGDRYSTGNPIAGTTRDWLYQTQRRGVSSFGAWLNEGVASMQVEVEFHFAELEATGAGQRVFDIVLEQGTPNEVTIPAVDVYDQVGAGRAYTLTSTVTVQDYQVDIDFLPRAGLPPMLNGLVLRGASGTGQRVVEQYVTVLNDDTYVVGTNNYRRAETVLLGGNDGYHGGFRFFYIQIPQEATINRAFVTLTAAEESYKEMNLKIYAHDVDHSPNFQDPPLVPDRARTDHYVTWNFLGSEGWVPGRIYTSPDLSDVVQEVIDRPGWQERNALSFLFIADPGGDIPREAWAADGSFEDRAYLKIYFTQETGAPTPAPTRTPTPIPTDTPTPTRTFTPSPTNTPTQTPTSTSTFTPTPHAAYLPLIFQPSGKAW